MTANLASYLISISEQFSLTFLSALQAIFTVSHKCPPRRIGRAELARPRNGIARIALEKGH